MDKKFYVNVADLMLQHIPEPRLRRTTVYDRDDGFIKILGVDVGKCQ